MTGPEIHPAVDANRVQAQRNAEAFSEATRRAIAEATALAEIMKHRRRKRAVISLIIRVVATIATSCAVCLARRGGLMTGEVAIVLLTMFASWLSLWIGAWMQFMWGKDGVLK